MGLRAEREAAQRLSERIEMMLSTTDDQEANDLLDTAQQLSRLGELFGPPDPAFERRLTARIEARLAERSPQRLAWRPRLAWGAAMAVVLVLAMLLTSPGRAVVAELMAVIRLGQTEVRVERETPNVARTFTGAAEITLSGLPEAQATVVPRTLQVPEYLPEGYELHRVSTSHFDELPAWAQPLFINVTYRRETAEMIWELSYRQYFVSSGGAGTIRALTYPPEEVEAVQEVSVGGHPAVLLTRQLASPVQQILHLVWEGENAVFTLTSFELPPEELIRIAESVAPYR